MLPDIVTIGQLVDRVGPVADLPRAAAALSDASAEVHDVSDEVWVDADGFLTVVPDRVVTITLAVAMRLYVNPHGYESETIGDYTYRLGEGRGLAELTARETRAIRAAAGKSAIGSIQLVSPYPLSASVVTVVNGGDPLA